MTPITRESLSGIAIRIHGHTYKVDEDANALVTDNDIVLDTKDGTWGIVSLTAIEKGFCAVSSNGCSELRVPLERLIRLKPINKQVN